MVAMEDSLKSRPQIMPHPLTHTILYMIGLRDCRFQVSVYLLDNPNVCQKT